MRFVAGLVRRFEIENGYAMRALRRVRDLRDEPARRRFE
jgi:hypothetical protein